MSSINFPPETRLTLYPLVVRPHGTESIIGRVATGTFISVPKMGMRIIEGLQHGQTLAQTEALVHAESNGAIDLAAFVADLLDLGFVQAIDDAPVAPVDEPPDPLPWLQPKHVRWMFSWPALLLAAGLLAAAAVTLFRQPELLPLPADFFWSPLLSMVIAVNVVFWTVRRGIHEIAHVAAARAEGLPFQLRPGRRPWSIFLQADASGAWALPRTARYRIYGAGLLWDITAASMLLLLLAYAPLSSALRSVTAAWFLLGVLALIGEFRFFARTDVYQICLDLIPVRDPVNDIVRRLRRQETSRPSTDADGHGRVAHFVLALLATTAIVASAVVLVALPVLISLVGQAVAHLSTGIHTADSSLVLDGAFALLATTAVIALLLDSVLRRRRPALTSPSIPILRRFRSSASTRAPMGNIDSPTSASQIHS